jgi:NitT/TauT family transport system substrate-binding protein
MFFELRRAGIATLLACVLFATACQGADSTAQDPADGSSEANAVTEGAAVQAASVTLMLPFQKSLSFWSSMLADELGYFEEENLEVAIEPSGGGTEALQQVIAGNADMALVAPAVILQSVAEGNDLVVPYTDKHGGLFSIVVPADSEIQRPEDLKGATVGITDFAGGEVPMVRAILGRAGLTVDQDVTLVTVGEGNPATFQALEDGRIDAYGASWSDFIPLMGLGMELREVTYPELSGIPSEVLVTTGDYFAENVDIVERVGRAMAKASYFATQADDETLALMRELAPEDHEDTDLARLALGIWYDIADYPQDNGEYVFGQHDPAAWEELEAVLAEHADLSTDVDVDSVLDDSLVSAFNDFDHEAVTQQAEELGLTYP